MRAGWGEMKAVRRERGPFMSGPQYRVKSL
jgi:hypothetical protein